MRALAALALVGLGAPALAQDAISLSAVRHVQHGDAVPSVTFTPGVRGNLDVSLSCGGRRYGLSTGIAPGVAQVLSLDGLGVGDHSCSGRLSLEAEDGSTGEMPLSLQVSVHPPLKLAVKADELDLDRRSMWLESDRPLKAVAVEVVGEKGAVLGDAQLTADGMTRMEVPWTQRDGEVLQVRVVGTDAYDLRGELVLSPWSYAIPHEDVVFESGQHAIRDSEVAKLEAAWNELVQVRDRYGDVVQMRLYVAGYTDTVGPAASNQALSERRARAIATWFKQRGFAGTVSYQGFGEEALAVPTPDNTDEAANRRSVYVVAADRPPISSELPRSAWKAL